MNSQFNARSLFLASTMLVLGAFATPAAAQSGCQAFENRAARIRCMERDAEFYRQQAADWDNYYRSERQRHEEVGRALRRTPGGQVWGGAWDAPRHAQDAYERYRDPEGYREDRRRQREWRRRNH